MTSTIAVKKLYSAALFSATKLKTLWQPLWRILSFNPTDKAVSYESNLCVDIDETGIFVAYGSRFLSRIRIKALKHYPLAWQEYQTPEDVASAVAMAVNELGIKNTGITLSIPKAWAIIRTVVLPSAVRENVTDVVSYELDRLTPLNSEDALYDFRILSETEDKLTIQIVAAKADAINSYISAMKERGLDVTSVTVNLSCMKALCRYIDKKPAYLFLRINENSYEGALFLEEAIDEVFAGNFETADEKTRADMLIAEIEPLINKLRVQGKEANAAILLNNKNSVLKELLKLKINIPSIMLNEAYIKLKIQDNQENIYNTALGGVLEALWQGTKGLNLTKKGRYERERTPAVFTIILLVAIIAIWVIYIIAPLQIERKRLDKIDHQIIVKKEEARKIEPLKKEMDSLNSEIYAIENFKKNRPMSIDMVKELTSIIPKTAWLTRMRIAEANIELEGYAVSATELLSKIEGSKYFRKAEFSSPTYWDGKVKANKFTIRAEIRGSKTTEKKVKK